MPAEHSSCHKVCQQSCHDTGLLGQLCVADMGSVLCSTLFLYFFAQQNNSRYSWVAVPLLWEPCAAMRYMYYTSIVQPLICCACQCLAAVLPATYGACCSLFTDVFLRQMLYCKQDHSASTGIPTGVASIHRLGGRGSEKGVLLVARKPC